MKIFCPISPVPCRDQTRSDESLEIVVVARGFEQLCDESLGGHLCAGLAVGADLHLAEFAATIAIIRVPIVALFVVQTDAIPTKRPTASGPVLEVAFETGLDLAVPVATVEGKFIAIVAGLVADADAVATDRTTSRLLRIRPEAAPPVFNLGKYHEEFRRISEKNSIGEH